MDRHFALKLQLSKDWLKLLRISRSSEKWILRITITSELQSKVTPELLTNVQHWYVLQTTVQHWDVLQAPYHVAMRYWLHQQWPVPAHDRQSPMHTLQLSVHPRFLCDLQRLGQYPRIHLSYCEADPLLKGDHSSTLAFLLLMVDSDQLKLERILK